ncbi:MAG: hypothetical protein ACJ76Z_02630 [Thermoleophilaceae bacterium]
MAPTGVRVVEQVVQQRNAGELEGPLATRLAPLGPGPLELRDYRTVGDNVIAVDGERTLVFTVKRSRIEAIEVFEPGQRLPDALVTPPR